MSALKINNDSFEDEVLKSEIPVLVDFWADWCGPCKMIGPVIEEIAEELEGSVKVCKVNVDECRDLAIQYKIMSIPTLVVFKDGEIAKEVSGALPKDAILDLINN